MRRTDSFVITLGITLLWLVVSCNDRPVSAVDPEQTRQEWTEFPYSVNPNLDLLFVIDNSGSMFAEQTSLAANFSRIVNVLATLEGGMPNLHIGVVSTDMGCSVTGTGDHGLLQNAPRVADCQPPDGMYIIDTEGERNFEGSLADAFSCIAQLGTNGCGFEQPLAAMEAALDGTNVANTGFLRDDARLAVVFISDEDDCSIYNPNMLQDPNAGPESALGPYSSFRCFEFGVECKDVTDPRTLGTRTECHPLENSSYMEDVNYYVGFLRGLKQFPDSDIMVAGIIGSPAPIDVVADPDGNPCLMYSCGTATVCGNAGELPGAVPPIRLDAFLNSFKEPQITTICNDDLSDAVQKIAEWMKRKMQPRCLQGVIADTDPTSPGIQYECVVSETRPGQDESTLARCDDDSDPQSSTNLPCYAIQPDLDNCGDTATHLRVEAYYPLDEIVPPDTMIQAFCVAE